MTNVVDRGVDATGGEKSQPYIYDEDSSVLWLEIATNLAMGLVKSKSTMRAPSEPPLAGEEARKC